MGSAGIQVRDYDRVVNITSVDGLVALVEMAAYVLVKHGIADLTWVKANPSRKAHDECDASFIREVALEAETMEIAVA